MNAGFILLNGIFVLLLVHYANDMNTFQTRDLSHFYFLQESSITFVQIHVDTMFLSSLNNRCVTVSGIIFHSVSSFPLWPCMLMAWPSTPPSYMTTEPSLTPPPSRGCSLVPAGVNLCWVNYSSLSGFWHKWMQEWIEESCFLSFFERERERGSLDAMSCTVTHQER